MTAPLSPAAREAIEWLIDRLQNSTKPDRVGLGEFLNNGLLHVPVVTAEPVSVLPEGDGTREGLSDDLRADPADDLGVARIRADQWRQAAKKLSREAAELRGKVEAARAERDRLREEVTQLRAERDAVPSPGTRWSKALRERNAAWDELDALRAELTQLRTERDEARAAVKSLGVAYRTLQELCAAMDGSKS